MVAIRAGTRQDIDAQRDVPAAIVLDEAAWPPLAPRRRDFDGVTQTPGAASRELSLFLLDLYAVASRASIGEFECRFFQLLSRYLPFDAAWTGVANHTPGGPVMHNSYLYRLPHAFFIDWKRVRDCDPLAHRTLHGAYGRAAILSVVEPGLDGRFRDWCVKYGLAQLMCVCTLDRRFGLTTFLSIYRHALNRPFTEEDARRYEDVIAHLAAALTINRAAQLTRLRSEAAASTVRAICDNFGVLHHAMPASARCCAANGRTGRVRGCRRRLSSICAAACRSRIRATRCACGACPSPACSSSRCGPARCSIA